MKPVFLLVLGAVATGLGLALGGYLAAEAWSPGAVGFPLLLASPGLALMASAAEVWAGRYLLAVIALAVGLVGLGVTDSARQTVVVAGYVVAFTGAAAVVGSLALRRPQMDSV